MVLFWGLYNNKMPRYRREDRTMPL